MISLVVVEVVAGAAVTEGEVEETREEDGGTTA